jgi:hypothetical protein
LHVLFCSRFMVSFQSFSRDAIPMLNLESCQRDIFSFTTLFSLNFSPQIKSSHS